MIFKGRIALPRLETLSSAGFSLWGLSLGCTTPPQAEACATGKRPVCTLTDSLQSAMQRLRSSTEKYEPKIWRESEPDVPEGDGYKDFGSFKICGEGKYPKPFLFRGEVARGKKL